MHKEETLSHSPSSCRTGQSHFHTQQHVVSTVSCPALHQPWSQKEPRQHFTKKWRESCSPAILSHEPSTKILLGSLPWRILSPEQYNQQLQVHQDIAVQNESKLNRLPPANKHGPQFQRCPSREYLYNAHSASQDFSFFLILRAYEITLWLTEWQFGVYMLSACSAAPQPLTYLVQGAAKAE